MDATRLVTRQEDVPWVAVLVCRNPHPHNNTHAAVAYRAVNGQLAMAHMAHHERFFGLNRDGRTPIPYDPAFLCAVPKLDPVLAESFADYCSRVARANHLKQIPYVFLYHPRVAFDVNGTWLPLTQDGGLNCSSFASSGCPAASQNLRNRLSFPQATITSPSLDLNGWYGTMFGCRFPIRPGGLPVEKKLVF